MKKTSSGFTIVELLIVIVVISILASITVVGFNGVQTRAKNAAREQVANEMYKIAKAYTATNGTSGILSNLDPNGAWIVSATCIGSGFPDDNSDGRGDCLSYIPVQADAISSIPAIDTAFASTGIQGKGVYPEVSSGANIVRGVWILSLRDTVYNLNGVNGGMLIGYWLEGQDQKCSVGQQMVFDHQTGSMYYYVDSNVRNWSSTPTVTICASHLK